MTSGRTAGLAAKFGLFIDKFGFSERANVILDEQRKAVFVWYSRTFASGRKPFQHESFVMTIDG